MVGWALESVLDAPGLCSTLPSVSQDSGTLPPHFRWNFGAFLVDYVCFGIALAFANPGSVLPAFVVQLTDSAPIIGLVDTVFRGGWLLPQLAVARLVSDKPRKKPYLIAGFTGRVSLFVMALAAWFGLAQRPAAMLILFYICLGVFTSFDGLSSVPWFDIMARAIPLRRRGRLLGVGQVISGIAGVGAGVLVGLILDRRPFPQSYALLFALAGIALIPSTVALLLIKEPKPEDTQPETSPQAKGGWLNLLAIDPAFRHLMACRLMIGMMALANTFYVVHAADELHLPESIIGQFVSAQTLAGVIAGIVLSLVTERWGPRYVIRVGTAAAVIGPLFALTADVVRSEWLVLAYPLVFAALGVVNCTWMMGFFNYLLEIAPEHLRPAYVGLGNTIMGVLTLAPMVGGWILEAASYRVLFGTTAALLMGSFVLSLGLKPPPETQELKPEKQSHASLA
jgi:MFS family permease